MTDDRSLAVVVLAAGRGSRLATTVDEQPKWLVRVDDASIAEWQLEGLRRAAHTWSRLLVVTGYRSDAFDASWIAAAVGRECELVYNAMYATRNNWFSLHVALERLAGESREGSVCVLNSDLLLAPQILQRFLESARRARYSLLAVDLDVPPSDEQMNVVLDARGRQITDIGKGALTGAAAGEFIGLSKIDARDLPLLRQVLGSFAADPAHDSDWYEGAFRETMRMGAEFAFFPVETGRWIEIDDPRDLERARDVARLLREAE